MVRDLALALQHAHERGVVHRDLKPQNVMVSPSRGLVVIDFGLVRRAVAEDSFQTRAGDLLGTPAYMAPEQVDGDLKAIGPATDVYSLGVILYQLLTNRLPFEGESIYALMHRIVSSDPRPPSALRPGLDGRLEAIVLKAMARPIEGRHASMAELAAALDDFLQTPPPRPQPEPVKPDREAGPQLVGEKPPTGNSRPRAWLAAAFGVLVLALGVVIYVQTDKGRVAIDIADPASVKVVLIDDRRIELEHGALLSLRTGEHDLEVIRGDLEVQTRRFTIRRGDGNPAVTVEYEPGRAGSAGQDDAADRVVAQARPALPPRTPMPMSMPWAIPSHRPGKWSSRRRWSSPGPWSVPPPQPRRAS